jgi:hypothetical protein
MLMSLFVKGWLDFTRIACFVGFVDPSTTLRASFVGFVGFVGFWGMSRHVTLRVSASLQKLQNKKRREGAVGEGAICEGE